MLTGDNGLLTKASTAKTETELKSEEEQVRLAIAAALVNEDVSMDKKTLREELSKIEGLTGVPTDDTYSLPLTITGKTGNKYKIEDTGKITIKSANSKPGEPNAKGIFTETSTINGEEGTANNPTIPEGFKPIDTDTSSWGDGSNPLTEQDVKNGLVIQDENENEFVWIPVPVLNEFARLQEVSTENYRGVLYNWYTDSTGNTPYDWSATSTSYREPANLSDPTYGDEANSSEINDWTETLYQKEYNKMVSSVSLYEGFYVGRYEMSVSNDTNKIAQSKKDQTSANASEAETRAWYGLYNKAKTYAPEKNSDGTENTKQKVVSSMIWGSQYDAMMRWMQKNSIDVTAKPDDTKRTTTRTTGGNENDILNNVYDIYWNSCEWTQEASGTDGRVGRRRRLLQ